MTVLRPVLENSVAMPHVFECVIGTHELLFYECKDKGEIVYAHESGELRTSHVTVVYD